MEGTRVLMKGTPPPSSLALLQRTRKEASGTRRSALPAPRIGLGLGHPASGTARNTRVSRPPGRGAPRRRPRRRDGRAAFCLSVHRSGSGPRGAPRPGHRRQARAVCSCSPSPGSRPPASPQPVPGPRGACGGDECCGGVPPRARGPLWLRPHLARLRARGAMEAEPRGGTPRSGGAGRHCVEFSLQTALVSSRGSRTGKTPTAPLQFCRWDSR